MMLDMRGYGSEQDPYQITNINQFRAIIKDLSAYYELANDIDARNDGELSNPIGCFETPFTGVLDGNDYEFKNLYINQPEQKYAGLFGFNRGWITNLGVRNITFSDAYTCGGLVGNNCGRVSFSYVIGDVSGGEYVGGLTGFNEGDIVSSYSKGDVSGDTKVGGLTGENWGQISSSYSVGSVSGEYTVGGLVGQNFAQVESSFVAGDISGEGMYKGSLIGCNYDMEAGTNSFVFSNLGERNMSNRPDLVISKDNWGISYVIDTNTLYLEEQRDIYSCTKVSPVQVQELVESFEGDIKTITDDFKSAIIISY